MGFRDFVLALLIHMSLWSEFHNLGPIKEPTLLGPMYLKPLGCAF